MSFAELMAMRDQINQALSSKIESERSELQKRLAALDEMGGGSTRGSGRKRGRPAGSTGKRRGAKPGTKVKPKYRGPNGELWSGRGNAPRWLAALEKTGKKRDSYLI
jgi:DNA-binding protein H-NS